MKSKFILYLSLIAVTAFISCKSKDAIVPDKGDLVYTNTPLQLNIPNHFPRLADSIKSKEITVQGANLGRMLFYDPILSEDNTISCGSCHLQSKAFADDKALSIGVKGRVGFRNTMSLANMLWIDNFFWDGRSSSLEEQVLIPIQDFHEMNLTMNEMVFKLQNSTNYPSLFNQAFGSPGISPTRVADALRQFVSTMVSSNSKYDRYLQGIESLTTQELQGERLFYTHPEFPTLRGANCGDCHSGSLQSDNQFRNNGLDLVYADDGLFNVTGNQGDKAKFRVMSLRNIALTAPYMHDGRFNTLQEVLDHYNEHVKIHANIDPLMDAANSPFPQSKQLELTPSEISSVIAFLHTLTDTSFVNNPAFSNPFNLSKK